MKIEWLNEEMTEARLTRGWWRKETAHVRRVSEDEYRANGYNRWLHAASGRRCGCDGEIEGERDAEIHRHNSVADWQRVEQVPVARLVERKP